MFECCLGQCQSEELVERLWMRGWVGVPGYGGLVGGCLVVSDCAHPLLPVPLVCEGEGWGYQIDQGNTGSRFTAEGETIV